MTLSTWKSWDGEKQKWYTYGKVRMEEENKDGAHTMCLADVMYHSPHLTSFLQQYYGISVKIFI